MINAAALREAIRRLEAGETGREVDLFITRIVDPERAAQPWLIGSAAPFTASIDVAVTLVPEGYDVTLEWDTEPLSVWNPSARLERANLNLATANAPTVAAALALAALRAHLAMLGVGDVTTKESAE